MATAAAFELRLAGFADLVRAGHPPGRNPEGPTPTDHLPIRPHRRAPNRVASAPTTITAAPLTTPDAWQGQHLDRSQTRAICAAASFLGQAYGQCLNHFLVFHHSGENHGDGVRTVNDFHRRARQRLARRGQEIYPFIYVHEAGSDGRLTTRFACQVELERDAHFLSWIATGFMPSRAGRRTTFGTIEACQRHARGERVAFHHRCVLELLRGVDPTLEAWDENGRRTRLIDCLGVPPGKRRSLGTLTCPQRFGTADALGPDCRRAFDEALPLVDLFELFGDDAWARFRPGWELDEHAARVAEADALDEERRRIDVCWPAGANALVQAGRANALAALEARRTRPPESRNVSSPYRRAAVG